MPELPEVETIVDELRPLAVGRRIAGVSVHWSGSIAGLDPAYFVARLLGQQIVGLARRGKFILLRLDGGDVLLVHLRMTGRLLLRAKGAPADAHTRVVIDLDGDAELRFTDARKFGRMVLASEGEVQEALAKLGPEPLGDDFTAAELGRILGQRRAPIKSLLLDQTRLAGLGNIYADEALFLAGIRPLRRADTLAKEDLRRLYAGIRRALADGVRNRGTTFSSYRDARGRPGLHQESLNVYRRTGLPCPRCGTPIERLVVGGRSSHFCPRCQV